MANTLRMSKLLTLLLLSLACLSPLSASKAADLAALRRGTVLPVVAGLGQAAGREDAEPLPAIAQALRSPYGFEWTETRLDPGKRKALERLCNDVLSRILPAGKLVFGEPRIADGVCSVAVLLPEESLRLDLLVDIQTLRILYIMPKEVDL